MQTCGRSRRVPGLPKNHSAVGVSNESQKAAEVEGTCFDEEFYCSSDLRKKSKTKFRSSFVHRRKSARAKTLRRALVSKSNRAGRRDAPALLRPGGRPLRGHASHKLSSASACRKTAQKIIPASRRNKNEREAQPASRSRRTARIATAVSRFRVAVSIQAGAYAQRVCLSRVPSRKGCQAKRARTRPV